MRPSLKLGGLRVVEDLPHFDVFLYSELELNGLRFQIIVLIAPPMIKGGSAALLKAFRGHAAD